MESAIGTTNNITIPYHSISYHSLPCIVILTIEDPPSQYEMRHSKPYGRSMENAIGTTTNITIPYHCISYHS